MISECHFISPECQEKSLLTSILLYAMSRKEYSFCQEDVCIWFKSRLEGHSRIELMCSLLDICLPLELRFLGTYLEYAAGKHHAHLQKWERDSNNPASFSMTPDLRDAKTRRRICLFMTLLHSHNKLIASKLFDVLSLYENLAHCAQTTLDDGTLPSSISSPTSTSQSTQSNAEHNNVINVPTDVQSTAAANPLSYDHTSLNEFKLLLTMSSFHPAFSFNQRQIIRGKLEQFNNTLQTTKKDVSICEDLPDPCSLVCYLLYSS